MSCPRCREKVTSLKASWEAYFTPEPEIAPSLMRVYSKLQKDETLILKGWKLSKPGARATLSERLFREGWVFRGAVSAAGLATLVFIGVSRFSSAPAPVEAVALATKPQLPFAQIRIQEKDAVRVHYVQPELLESVEFETTSRR